MDDASFDSPPSDFTLPNSITADTETDGATTESDVTNLPFTFCIWFRKRSVIGPLTVYAPSPDLAAVTLQQLLDGANSTLADRGYPPNSLSAVPGECR